MVHDNNDVKNIQMKERNILISLAYELITFSLPKLSMYISITLVKNAAEHAFQLGNE